MEKDLTKYYTVEDARTRIYKENLVQGGIASPEKAIKRKEKEYSQEHKDQLAKVDAQQKFEDNVICTNYKQRKEEYNQQTGERQEISEDGGKNAFMNDAFIVSSKWFQWNVIFMILTVIFIVKGTLSWKEKSVAHNQIARAHV